MIQVLKCPQCRAPASPKDSKCKFCRSYFIITDARDLDSISPDGIGQYQKFYQKAIDKNPDDGNAVFALGLCFFKLKLYDLAREQFERAIKLLPNESDVYFYNALTYLNGRRPRVLTINEIEKLESFLEAASDLAPDRGIFDYSRAIIKYDYYHGNGLKIKPPKIKELLHSARKKQIKEGELDQLWDYLKIRDKILRNDILRIKDYEEIKKRIAIRRYFGSGPWIACLVLLLGLVQVYFDIPLDYPKLPIAILCIAIGVFFIIRHLLEMPSEARMDKYLDDDIERLRTILSADALGIDESQLTRESEIVYGPAEDLTNINSKKKGKVLRYINIRAEVVLFGRDQLMCYSCIFDFASGNISEESTDEYFYKDVVSVSTEPRTGEFEIRGKKYNLDQAEVFKLTTSGGTAIELLISNKKYEKMSDKPLAMARQAVLSIRRMLRDKKAGIA